MNTMEITKIVGGLCSTLLVFLLVKTGADAIIHGAEGGHGDEHHNAYVIEVEDAGTEVAEEEPAEEVDIATLMAEADAASGEKVFRACSACHKLEVGANAVGPHLAGIVGRNVGSADGYAYSEALAGMDEIWSYENLSAFLAAPSDWAPGTKMSYRGLKDAEDRADLIAYLETIGG